MASAGSEWSKLDGDVKKIMGDKAKLPVVPSNVKKCKTDENKAWDEFQKAISAAEKKLLDWQNVRSTQGNTLSQFGDKVETSDLGCDKSAADYKKKRAEAQKLIDAFFKDLASSYTKNQQDAKELDRHMRNLSDYKPTETPSV